SVEGWRVRPGLAERDDRGLHRRLRLWRPGRRRAVEGRGGGRAARIRRRYHQPARAPEGPPPRLRTALGRGVPKAYAGPCFYSAMAPKKGGLTHLFGRC